jgi:hypothetical protein
MLLVMVELLFELNVMHVDALLEVVVDVGAGLVGCPVQE